MSVLIIGGGIGGLSAAVALRRVGIAARVFERAPEIREVGAGVTIWSNAVKALRCLGLEQQFRSLGSEMRRINFRSPSGRLISSTDVEEVSRACGAPSVALHRADLQRMLLDALEGEGVLTEKECAGITQDPHGVAARFAGGAEATGTIAVGADGIRSAVAASLFGREELRKARYYCYRAIADTPQSSRHEVLSLLLPGIQFGAFPEVRPNETYWFLCVNGPSGSAAPGAAHEHSDLLRSVAGKLPPGPGQIIAQTDPERILVDEVHDRPGRTLWGRGRISLLGDAAHPTTPTFGQGACMAIEDAVVLADSLRRAQDPVSGLRDYENRRRSRTAMITRLSWRYGNILQWEHPAMVTWRTIFAASPLGPWNLRRILGQTMRYDPPELRSG